MGAIRVLPLHIIEWDDTPLIRIQELLLWVYLLGLLSSPHLPGRLLFLDDIFIRLKQLVTVSSRSHLYVIVVSFLRFKGHNGTHIWARGCSKILYRGMWLLTILRGNMIGLEFRTLQRFCPDIVINWLLACTLHHWWCTRGSGSHWSCVPYRERNLSGIKLPVCCIWRGISFIQTSDRMEFGILLWRNGSFPWWCLFRFRWGDLRALSWRHHGSLRLLIRDILGPHPELWQFQSLRLFLEHL